MARPPTTIRDSVEVWFRDRWLCNYCRRPTIFSLTFKLLERQVRQELRISPAYYGSAQIPRNTAPLLDELGACIDHQEPYAPGGAHQVTNFVTACNRCNQRKGTKTRQQFMAEANHWVVKGKGGEPTRWDGLTSLFVLSARESPELLTAREKMYLKEFDARLSDGRFEVAL